MDLTIKQLQQYGEAFIPQTAAEAVLVKSGEEVITLDNMLQRKLERIVTPANSGLNSYQQGINVILTHSNSIEANEAPIPVKVQYDNRGHIVGTAPINKNRVMVNNQLYNEYDGSEDQIMLMGDDFEIDKDKKIILKWNNI